MKVVFQAARNILYPSTTSRRAGARFAEGQSGCPASLAQALMEFEHALRGHRDLLQSPALSANSTALIVGNGEQRLPRSMRKTIRTAAYRLCRTVLELNGVPNELVFQHLFTAEDTLGYFREFVYSEIKYFADRGILTGLPIELGITSMRVELGMNPVLHVRITRHRDKSVATRAIVLSGAAPTSLQGVVQFMAGSRYLIQAEFKDASKWPEFSDASNASAPVSKSNPEVDAFSASLQKSLTPPALDMPVFDLTAQLQEHMQLFLNMYSPTVQDHFAQHWDALRPGAVKK